MKKLIFLAVLVIAATAVRGQQTTTPKTDVAVFEWVTTSHDFGKIKQGVPVTHEFRFKNKSKIELVIAGVQPSCGCTTPEWTKTPIPPGGEGYIKATYNAGGIGPFNKTVTVTANTDPGTIVLTIKGETETAAPQR